MKSVTKETFKNEILESKKTILLDVWALWCSPCRAMNPILESLEKELPKNVEIMKLDAQTEEDLSRELEITGLPTFLVFKNGIITNRHIGMTNKQNLLKLIS